MKTTYNLTSPTLPGWNTSWYEIEKFEGTNYDLENGYDINSPMQ